MTFTRRTFLGATASALAIPGIARGAGPTVSTGGPAFGSYWRLTLPDGRDPGPAARAIAAIIAQVDGAASPYRSDSELTAINRSSDNAFSPSRGLAPVVRRALEIAGETGGAFDPTFGPAAARYGFSPITGGEPGRWSDFTFDGETLRRANPGSTLDFCGLAKGYALDLMSEALRRSGEPDFLLDLGGEVATAGRHPEGRRWRVAVDGAQTVLALADTAVATSGRLAQSYEVGSRAYTHIIDPETGRPATGSLVSVSVFDPDAMRADALATALFAMGADRATRFAREGALDALLFVETDDGRGVTTTGRAARYVLV